MLAPNKTFEQLLVDAMPNLKRYCISLTLSEHKAEDLMQETLLRALEHKEQFTIGTNLIAWLITIAQNYYRSSFRKAWCEVEDPELIYASSTSIEDDPTKRLIALETLALVGQLPPRFREVLYAVADGATEAEMAVEFGEHLGTVKSRISRARAMIGA